MNISELSLKYQIRKLDDKDIDLIYTLSIGNPKFYKYCYHLIKVRKINFI